MNIKKIIFTLLFSVGLILSGPLCAAWWNPATWGSGNPEQQKKSILAVGLGLAAVGYIAWAYWGKKSKPAKSKPTVKQPLIDESDSDEDDTRGSATGSDSRNPETSQPAESPKPGKDDGSGLGLRDQEAKVNASGSSVREEPKIASVALSVDRNGTVNAQVVPYNGTAANTIKEDNLLFPKSEQMIQIERKRDASIAFEQDEGNQADFKVNAERESQQEQKERNDRAMGISSDEEAKKIYKDVLDILKPITKPSSNTDGILARASKLYERYSEGGWNAVWHNDDSEEVSCELYHIQNVMLKLCVQKLKKLQKYWEDRIKDLEQSEKDKIDDLQLKEIVSWRERLISELKKRNNADAEWDMFDKPGNMMEIHKPEDIFFEINKFAQKIEYDLEKNKINSAEYSSLLSSIKIYIEALTQFADDNFNLEARHNLTFEGYKEKLTGDFKNGKCFKGALLENPRSLYDIIAKHLQLTKEQVRALNCKQLKAVIEEWRKKCSESDEDFNRTSASRGMREADTVIGNSTARELYDCYCLNDKVVFEKLNIDDNQFKEIKLINGIIERCKKRLAELKNALENLKKS